MTCSSAERRAAADGPKPASRPQLPALWADGRSVRRHPPRVIALGLSILNAVALSAESDVRETEPIEADLTACERGNRIRQQVASIADVNRELIDGIIDVVLARRHAKLKDDVAPVFDGHDATVAGIGASTAPKSSPVPPPRYPPRRALMIRFRRRRDRLPNWLRAGIVTGAFVTLPGFVATPPSTWWKTSPRGRPAPPSRCPTSQPGVPTRSA